MIFISLLFLINIFSFQDAFDEVPQQITCKEYLDAAKEARANRDPQTEITILEEAIGKSCAENSIAYSQLSLCFLELADQSYSNRNEEKDDKREEYFRNALQIANQAIQINPNNVYGYERKSMAFAGLVDVLGLRQKVQLADSVRINAEIALEIDPKNDRALHILGRWHYEVSQFGGIMRFFARLFFGTAPEASYEKALNYFKRSAKLQDFPVHHYWIGETQLKLKDEKSAKTHFEHLLTLENQHHNDEFFKKKALEELEKLSK